MLTPGLDGSMTVVLPGEGISGGGCDLMSGAIGWCVLRFGSEDPRQADEREDRDEHDDRGGAACGARSSAHHAEGDKVLHIEQADRLALCVDNGDLVLARLRHEMDGVADQRCVRE